MPPGSVAFNASKPTFPRHPLNRAAPSGSAASSPAAPIASATAGASASASTPSSPSISRGSSRLTARWPRSREPAATLSRSSKLSLLPASETLANSRTFCAALSDGFSENSGARLTLRTFRLRFAFCDEGSAVPCASASMLAPHIFALRRSG